MPTIGDLTSCPLTAAGFSATAAGAAAGATAAAGAGVTGQASRTTGVEASEQFVHAFHTELVTSTLTVSAEAMHAARGNPEMQKDLLTAGLSPAGARADDRRSDDDTARASGERDDH